VAWIAVVWLANLGVILGLSGGDRLRINSTKPRADGELTRAENRSRLVGHHLLRLVVAFCALAMGVVAASQASAATSTADLNGTRWCLVNPPTAPGVSNCADTWTFTATGPSTYTIENAESFFAYDVVISGGSASSYWCGNASETEATCDTATWGYWIQTLNFNFSGTGPPTFTGTYKNIPPSGGTSAGSGTYTGTEIEPAGALSVSVALSRKVASPESQVKATVTVSAAGGEVDAISLGKGLVSSDNAVALPASLSVPAFDLTAGAAKSVTYSLFAKSAGSAQLSIVVSGTTTSGQAVQATGLVSLKVQSNVVTGTIQYNYLSGPGYASGSPASSASQLTPARDTEVQILMSSSTACSSTVLSTVYTDDNGKYTSAPIPISESYFCVKILAKDKYSAVVPYSASNPAGGSSDDGDGAYSTNPIGPNAISASSGETTFSWTPSATDDTLDQALDVNNAVLTGAQWLDLCGVTPPFLKILYPYPATQAISNFNPTSSIADINPDDAFDWGVILHEYGHFVAATLGILNDTHVRTSQHGFRQNMTNIEGSKSSGLAIAWNEGFATFFSQMVQRAMGTASLGLPDVGADPPTYIDQLPNGGSTVLQLDAPGNSTPTPSLGEDNEVSVARVLWDIYTQDGYSASASTSVAFVKILVAAMTSNDNRDLYHAVDALMSTQRSQPWVPNVGAQSTDSEVPVHYNEAVAATTFGAILSSQNVAPTITSVAVSPSGRSISVSLKTGQPPNDDDELNMFLVQFWSSTWTTLYTEAVDVAYDTRVVDDTRVIDFSIPIPKNWISRAVQVVALGWNTHGAPRGLTLSDKDTAHLSHGLFPPTGPYISAPVSLTVG
jgi:hypothetical protein